ncbi:MAG: hypothetical protein QF898_03455 [SAR202 cluster bacterium]|jgi:hypothetical protein|nr:hypothetical protein [SAR202 cluster bacterium]MDP6514968.1 hypothetical protein [SAR202 cluster bacterium]MDP6715805.1 hypothetical protein [SAR202 cluster bacterium]
MIVSQAKEIARQWVIKECEGLTDFLGAYLVGSVTHLPDDVEFPGSSDVDVAVVLERPQPENKPTKFLYHNVLIEVNFPPWDQINSPQQVLGEYRRAGAFRPSNILSDPSGDLAPLFSAVSRDFAKHYWVRERCEGAMRNTRGYLQRVNEFPLHHDQVTCWLFGTAGLCHVVLTAGLQNPTVRRRYMEARMLLAEHGHLDLYEDLMELQGSAEIGKERVEHHLDAVTEVFDFAKDIIITPYRFASDISEVGRPISIGGSREFVDQGNHREAVYWIVATYSRCMAILHNDASLVEREKFAEGFHTLLADLGISSFADLQQRSQRVREFLPQVWSVAEAIMDANPAIED